MSEQFLPERLRRSGFVYNPFTSLESSRDPYLSKHIYYGNETYSIARESANIAIFAPIGGGKTALRIYTAQSCWKGAEVSRPLPVTMLLSPAAFAGYLPSRRDISLALTRAVTRSLLVDILLHPMSVVDQPADVRRDIAAFLQTFLPSPLDYYGLQLSTDGDLAALLADLDPSTRGAPVPPAHLVETAFEQLTALPPAHLPEDPLEQLVSLLLATVGYRALFVLVDGVDGVGETIAEPGRAALWLGPLLEIVSRYEHRGVYIKGFFPEEMREPLSSLVTAELPRVRETRIEWNEQLLTEMLRRRIWAATDGITDSMDSFADYGMQDVERQIVKLPGVARLPREVLALTALIVNVFSERSEGTNSLLLEDDLYIGLEQYIASFLYLPSPIRL